MSRADEIGQTGVSSWTAGAADDGGPGQGRVDLRRVLDGLRHLEASREPVRVFIELAAVYVPALCDECLIQIAEHGRNPYRIRRTWPDTTGTAPSMTDEAFSVVTQGRGTPLDGGRNCGAIVETIDRDVLARFTNPPGGGPDGLPRCAGVSVDRGTWPRRERRRPGRGAHRARRRPCPP